MVAECVFGPHVHLSGEYSSVFYSLHHSLLGNYTFFFCSISLSSLHLTHLLPICPLLSLNPSLSLIFYLSANPNIIVTHTNVYTLDMQARMSAHTNAYVRRHTAMHMHT